MGLFGVASTSKFSGLYLIGSGRVEAVHLVTVPPVINHKRNTYGFDVVKHLKGLI